jgi:mycofactocin radical SAM maturase
VLDLRRPYRLDATAAMRPEPFGALAYSFRTRRLVFLRSEELARLVASLERHACAEEALRALPPDRRGAVAAARDAHHGAGILGEADPPSADPGDSPAAGHAAGAGGGRRAAAPSRPEPALGPQPGAATRSLADRLERGLAAPVCLTWELTYACNLACVHCLSSSGRRDPAELSTSEAMAFLDALAQLSVFYVNVGGGEPTIRPDFDLLLEHAVERRVGVKFSTNGTTMTPERARRIAAMDYVDVQVSLDGASPKTNDPIRGEGSFEAARRAMQALSDAGVRGFKLSTVVTRRNADELDALYELAASYGAVLRLTRLRPAGRGASVFGELRPTPDQLRRLHQWLLDRPDVLTGDSFFHLSPLGAPLPGLNLCGAGRVVCLVDPVGDVYACPFAMHERFRAGNVRDEGGFAAVWRDAPVLRALRAPGGGGACAACGAYDACRGGCLAAKFFTGLDLDGPDPECVLGRGAEALARAGPPPSPGPGHSKPRRRPAPVRVALGRDPARVPTDLGRPHP